MPGKIDPLSATVREPRLEPTTPWWLSGTPLVDEHLKLMQARRKPVPWADTTASALTPDERVLLADTWRRRSQAEYLAISTFAVLSMDLCAAGAPADVISLTHRSAIDEVRHAELCARLASIYSGKQELPPPGLSDLPDDPTRPKRDQAVANALLVSCVAETVATVVLATVREDVQDPVVAAVLDQLYADEVVHARLGWAYLAHNVREGGDRFREVAAQMIPIAVAGAANVVDKPKPEDASTPRLRAHGFVTPGEERALFARTVREVLAPGFEAQGIAIGDLVDAFGQRWVERTA